jgi:hypothetical protein
MAHSNVGRPAENHAAFRTGTGFKDTKTGTIESQRGICV